MNAFKDRKLFSDLFQSKEHAKHVALRRDLELTERAKAEMAKIIALSERYMSLLKQTFFERNEVGYDRTGNN